MALLLACTSGCATVFGGGIGAAVGSKSPKAGVRDTLIGLAIGAGIDYLAVQVLAGLGSLACAPPTDDADSSNVADGS